MLIKKLHALTELYTPTAVCGSIPIGKLLGIIAQLDRLCGRIDMGLRFGNGRSHGFTIAGKKGGLGFLGHFGLVLGAEEGECELDRMVGVIANVAGKLGVNA